MNNRRPNLLFVFSDQQSRDVLGCSGNTSIRTPRLDRFAASSVRFHPCVANARRGPSADLIAAVKGWM